MSTDYFEAQGLSADWLNGWLAAIGITVVLEGVTLHWTGATVPRPRFGLDDPELLPERLATVIPSAKSIECSPIARQLDGCSEYPRNVSLDVFKERAAYERDGQTTILAATSTDLIPSDRVKSNGVEHAPLNPPVPRGFTLWERARATAEALSRSGDTVATIRYSLSGAPDRRVAGNGLGFDLLRLPASANADAVSVDPVVELLAYSALRLFPTRGNGHAARQRLWVDRATRRHAMRWPIWDVALDCWGIDAILDRPGRLPITRTWGSVPYVPATSSDTTRGYGSEVLM